MLRWVRRVVGVGASLCAAAWGFSAAGGCSSASGGPSGGFSAQGGGGNAAGAGGNLAGSGGAGGSGGFAGFGASGGSLPIDAPSGGTGGVAPDAECTSVAQEARPTLQPADIVWAVDTSGSMVEEALAVQQNLNRFAQQIVASGIDVHVVMIASCPFGFLPGVSIPAPLGSGQPCPNDTNLPGYFHMAAFPGVQSNDGMKILYERFNVYRPHLRANSLKYLVIVTDDEATQFPSGVDGNNFVDRYTALDPILRDANGNPAWSMNGLYAYSMCPNAAAVGNVWAATIQRTGGVAADICGCTTGPACSARFQQIIDQLATKIVQGAQTIDCEWSIPSPPAGQQLDPGRVNVELVDTASGVQTRFYKVSGQQACDPVLGGWYYDDEQRPTRVIACPTSCQQIEATAQGRVSVLFGCATVTIPE